eukprot:scaffold6834_cov128-Isochrysis_galbana.AAC.3
MCERSRPAATRARILRPRGDNHVPWRALYLWWSRDTGAEVGAERGSAGPAGAHQVDWVVVRVSLELECVANDPHGARHPERRTVAHHHPHHAVQVRAQRDLRHCAALRERRPGRRCLK